MFLLFTLLILFTHCIFGQSLKPYKMIFNTDGYSVFIEAKGNKDQWISNVFDQLKNTPVDALFWFDGAGGNTASYDSTVLERTGFRIGKTDPFIEQLIAEGNDPPKVIVTEAHKRGLEAVFAYRLNDIHDDFVPEEFPTFKEKHPEWLIGSKNYGRALSVKTALNFAIPEVREIKYQAIKEAIDKYDFDGIEIDFQRSSPYFLPNEIAANINTLTEFLQKVRTYANQKGVARGRPVRIAVRVDESLEIAKLNGLDVPTWIDKGLFDLLTLGSGVIEINIEEYKKLAQPKNIPVYACLYFYPGEYRPVKRELLAGLALNYYNQGADGLYLFNWATHRSDTLADGSGLMKALENPTQIKITENKLMFATERGHPTVGYPNNWLHSVLPTTVSPGQKIESSILITESFAPERVKAVTLTLKVDNRLKTDGVQVKFNNRLVKNLCDGPNNTLIAALTPSWLLKGQNKLSFILTRVKDRNTAARYFDGATLSIDLK